MEHTYTAQRLDTALARVKRELGTDAVILSSRRLERQNAFEVRAVAAEEASAWPSTNAPAEPLLTRLLVRNGLDPELARVLAQGAPGDPRTLREAAEALGLSLRSHLTFGAPQLDRGRHALAFIGPCGAGKTTTLAKLAAEAALMRQRKVGLITLDSYRVGATAQIEQYAELMGVPLEVARDAASFDRAMRRLSDAEVVLIDTAGRARRDKRALILLAEILHSTHYEVNVTLCIPAATRTVELEDIVERHAVVLPKTVTITKVDEAHQHDAIVHAHVASGLPLAWLTTGQRVPEDIEVASADKLAAALCGEEIYA